MNAKAQIWPDGIKAIHFQLAHCNTGSQKIASLVHFYGTELE